MFRGTEMAKRLGRPRRYTKALGDAICKRLSAGESLREICRDPEMPGRATVSRWLLDESMVEFRDHYARAREEQADQMFEEMLEICDDGSNDWTERRTRNGDLETVVDHEHIQRSRLRVDTRKWILARMNRLKYGDSSKVTVDGAIETSQAEGPHLEPFTSESDIKKSRSNGAASDAVH